MQTPTQPTPLDDMSPAPGDHPGAGDSPGHTGDGAAGRRSNWRRVPLVLLLLLIAFALVSTMIDGPVGNLRNAMQGPSLSHPLGTDNVGRDVLGRLVEGLMFTVHVSVLSAVVAGLVGTALGIASGWSDGLVSRALVRFVDFYVSFPYFVLVVVLLSFIGRGPNEIAALIGLSLWPVVARVVYGEVRQLRRSEYVMYGRLIWQNDLVVIVLHVIPAMRRRIAVICAYVFGDSVAAATGLSLLGLGPPLGTATWGNMMAEGRPFLTQAPWITGSAALAVIFMVVLVNLAVEDDR